MSARTMRARPLLAISIVAAAFGAACPKPQAPRLVPSLADSVDFSLSANRTIRIRGINNLQSTEPLFVVDGVLISDSATSSTTLAALDPRDIVSV